MNAKQLRALIDAKGYTQVSAALAIGIAPRTMRRYVSLEDDFRPAPQPVLMALTTLKRVKR